MYCKNCGEQIPENSNFCSHCGAVINACETDPISESTAPEDVTKSKDLDENKGCRTIFCAVMISIFLFSLISIISLNYKSPDVPASTSSTPTIESSLPEVLSQEQILTRKAFEMGTQGNIESSIKKLLKNPDTAVFTHDKSSWTAHNAILTGSGTVAYKNSKGQSVSEPFTVSVIMTDKYYYPLYVELNKTVSLDDRKGVNSLGIVTKTGASIFNAKQSNPLFQDEDGDLVVVYDENSVKITLDEYNRIETGMRYEEVTEIVGSYGVEMAHSEFAGYQTLIIGWEGIGDLGANANVTFSVGRVYAKGQCGLR
ncbi:zinc-ribbon domain-containing protein [Faecalispora anaeroviscerum]|uniref:zinc-ribbon domain-containing protein n=1 Tax=Faecalispora anaeroviscerum TaxID=2991836 RepID=UPI0024B9B8C5|nr:zinc-ribbon domain-containing protein [Faecalispora anaeroviscerum]